MFLRSQTTASLKRLVVDADQNSTYEEIEGNIEGHFKKVDLTDRTFDVSQIDGTAFKFTIKGVVDVKPSDRLFIESGEYTGEYSVQDFKYTKGITFNDTKILVVK